jgi:hypothetical protein
MNSAHKSGLTGWPYDDLENDGREDAQRQDIEDRDLEFADALSDLMCATTGTGKGKAAARIVHLYCAATNATSRDEVEILTLITAIMENS